METFDAALWRERAWERLKRKAEKSSKVSTAEERWAREVISINGIKLVIDWCLKKRLEVRFKKVQNGFFDAGTIVISCQSRPPRQLCYLLHECGHFLIGSNEEHARFGKGYPLQVNGKTPKSFSHKLACLEEEIEAWNRGWSLANRLKLNVEKDLYDSIREECIKTYVEWATR